MQIIYEPHPCSPERKQELIAQGYKIIDASFAPEGYEHPEQQEQPKRGRKPKQAAEPVEADDADGSAES